MIVYHGSSVEIKTPSVLYSKQFLDFGKGFYLTTLQTQAEKWAQRKAMRLGTQGFVSVYDLSDNYLNHKVLQFSNEDEKWLDFIMECRKGSDIYKEYDIIIGKVADDDVFKTVNMYFQGLWDKKRTIEELRYCKDNNQICIINQIVLNEILFFQYSYKVK